MKFMDMNFNVIRK